MNDTNKSCLSLFFLAAAFILPLVGLAVGWAEWDLRTGLIIAGVVFAVCFTAAGVLAALVRQIPWPVVALPFLAALIYLVLPDVLPGPLDDGVVVTAGTLLSILLALRKQLANGETAIEATDASGEEAG